MARLLGAGRGVLRMGEALSRRDRVGLETTTISVKLTAAELEALDGERKKHEGLFWSHFAESRGDALRRLISEAGDRRTEEKKRTDPRQVTLNEAIAAAADKTEQLESARELPRKTRRRPRRRKTRAQRSKASIRG